MAASGWAQTLCAFLSKATMLSQLTLTDKGQANDYTALFLTHAVVLITRGTKHGRRYYI